METKISKLITEYYKQHERSPFTNIDVKEDGEVIIDIENSFDEICKKEFGDYENELKEFIIEMIRTKVQDLESQDNQEK